MPDDAGMPEDGVAALQRLGQTLVRIGRNRRDLFLLEARAERVRGLGLLLLAGGVALSLAMAVAVATATVVTLCLRAGRTDLLVGLVVVFLGGGLLAFGELWRRLRRWQPFPATRMELRKDVAS